MGYRTPDFPILHHLPELACSNSCPLSPWYYPTISSSAVPFCSCLQYFPASGSFPISWLFISGGWSIEASTSASVPPKNNQHWFHLVLIGLISLQSKELSRVFSNMAVQKWILRSSALFMVQFSHPYITTRKAIALTRQTFAGKPVSLIFICFLGL